MLVIIHMFTTETLKIIHIQIAPNSLQNVLKCILINSSQSSCEVNYTSSFEKQGTSELEDK